MITLESFEKFYYGEFQEQIKPIKAERNRLVLKMFLNGLAALAFIVSIYLYAFFIYEPNQRAIDGNLALRILSILGFVIHVFMISFLIYRMLGWKGKFIARFKNEIIAEIIRFIEPNLKYYPNKYISRAEFTASRLFKREPDKYVGDDYVSGKLGSTAIQFSEIHTFYKVRSSDDNKERDEKIFSGLFIIADFNKDFQGRTFVLPDKWERKVGRLAHFFQSTEKFYGELVKMEDPEFEKYFKVYSSDQIEARYILSTSLMRRIIDFRKKTGIEILMSFVNSNLYLALPVKGKLFEPKIFGRIVSIGTIREYLTDLLLALSVVEDLNLNTRIWTKN